MRNISIVLLASTLLLASPVMAAPGHEHGSDGSHSHGPINSDAAITKAEMRIKSMVKRGKLDKSWVDAKTTGATKKAFKHGDEWVVTVKNDKISDAAMQTLHIFYTLDGSYTGSNFTGN